MKKITALSIFLALSFFFVKLAFSHCEVPCGIYNDEMRIELIREHITTIEKAMKKIEELSKESPVNYNQVVRWITNKEKHAEELQDIVHQYFMTQRIKPTDQFDEAKQAKYIEQITLLHRMLVRAMKTKQTTDLEHVEALRRLTDDFDKLYFEGKKHDH